jgi:formylmethanofuran dehydrogenase subunit E
MMAKGLLKFHILKMIAEGEVTGYQIIKKVGNLTGNKPSTGSIYPILESLQNEGWIKGKKSEKKTIYTITDSGGKKLKELDKIQTDFIEKIHQSISLANVTFEGMGHLTLLHNMDVLSPFINDISKLLEKGVDPDRIDKLSRRQEMS